MTGLSPILVWSPGDGTRRRLLQRLIGLLASGLAFLAAPPLAHGQASCSQWHRCGMCGCLCSCLGGSDTVCPAGTQAGGAWWACCTASGRQWLVRYLDCCGPRDRKPPCPTGCSGNQNGSCSRYPSSQNWCPNPQTQAAYCTRAQVWSQC